MEQASWVKPNQNVLFPGNVQYVKTQVVLIMTDLVQ